MPVGRRGCALHMTRGHLPKSPFLYFSSCKDQQTHWVRTRILTYHLCKPSRSRNVSCMDQAVQVPCRFLDLLSHIIVTIQVKDISDEIESVLIILDVRIEPSKVESVCEIVFVDLAEIFIASRRDELHAYLLVMYTTIRDKQK